MGLGLMPLFRRIHCLGRGWWALCLVLDVFFGGEGVGFMPLFRCIYLFLHIYFLKVHQFFKIFFA